MEQIFIQIKYKVTTEVGEFNDALYYTQSDYQNIPRYQIDTEKQSRIDNFINLIKNPPIAKDPTKQELQNAKSVLLAQIADLDIKISGAK